jgi:enediyne biosynthesis protein E4
LISRRGFIGGSTRAGLGAFVAPAFAGLAQAPAARPIFTEIPAVVSGLTWTHDNAVSVTRFLPESLGPGVAFLDYDNDGWMDVYLVNTGRSDFYTPRGPTRNALYRNNRDGTFTDVTERAGVAGGTFGTGVAVGDYDNDGLPDLFVTAYGRCLLYHNNGDGTFTDVTERAGVAAPGFTTSALWFDFDGDGLLDLFVASYVDYSPSAPRLCADKVGNALAYHYCIPHLFKPTSCLLFKNNGNGTFRRADPGTVIAKSPAKALGAVATDVNNDGRLDVFVANDTAPNLLFVNRGGNWLEQGVRQGVAYGETGRARSGMGVDAADLDGDGWQDLAVANIDHEMYALYRNERGEFFTDVARDQGLSEATRLMSGWGLKFFDVDNDGRVDLFLGNGHPDDTITTRAREVSYRQPPLLFMHDGRRLRNVSAQAGPVFQRPLSVRGLAVGDTTNDGRLDVLLGINGGQPVLLRNTTAGNNWAGIRLQGVRANRDAVGARITWSAGGTRRSRLKTGGGSYLSSHDPREVLGLGTAASIEWVEVAWPAPSRLVERFDVVTGRYTTLREGEGRPV